MENKKINTFLKSLLNFCNLTKFKGWFPLLPSPLASSESEVTRSEWSREGLGELEGVDFLVVKSNGCSPLPEITKFSPPSPSSKDSVLVLPIKFHPERPRLRLESGKPLYKAEAGMTLGESLPPDFDP
jgi:hypothetical protein